MKLSRCKVSSITKLFPSHSVSTAEYEGTAGTYLHWIVILELSSKKGGCYVGF